MAMKLIAAVDVESEGLLLRKKLAPALNRREGIELATVHPSGLLGAVDDTVFAVLLCSGVFREAHRLSYRRLREVGYEGPILIVSKLDSPELLNDIRRAQNAHFLERPYDPRDLIGLVEKFAKEMEVSQRIHRRYETNEPAEVEVDGVRSRSVLRNLSRGGAYVEVEDGPLPRAGETVTLKIALRNVRRAYSMRAKVVWITLSGSDGRTGLGVEFIGPADVRRTLIGAR